MTEIERLTEINNTLKDELSLMSLQLVDLTAKNLDAEKRCSKLQGKDEEKEKLIESLNKQIESLTEQNTNLISLLKCQKPQQTQHNIFLSDNQIKDSFVHADTFSGKGQGDDNFDAIRIVRRSRALERNLRMLMVSGIEEGQFRQDSFPSFHENMKKRSGNDQSAETRLLAKKRRNRTVPLN